MSIYTVYDTITDTIVKRHWLQVRVFVWNNRTCFFPWSVLVMSQGSLMQLDSSVSLRAETQQIDPLTEAHS